MDPQINQNHPHRHHQKLLRRKSVLGTTLHFLGKTLVVGMLKTIVIKGIIEKYQKVEGYIIDHFYGDWYWNCALIIGTCFFSWFLLDLEVVFYHLDWCYCLLIQFIARR